MITKFKQFEASHFHTMKDIDVILDKISVTGLESLDPSEYSILMNYSEDDKYIHNVLIAANDTAKKLKKMEKNLLVITKNDKEALEKISKPYTELNLKMQMFNTVLSQIFKIDDPNDIRTYLQQTGIGDDLEDMISK